jgi:hypothetical protein
VHDDEQKDITNSLTHGFRTWPRSGPISGTKKGPDSRRNKTSFTVECFLFLRPVLVPFLGPGLGQKCEKHSMFWQKNNPCTKKKRWVRSRDRARSSCTQKTPKVGPEADQRDGKHAKSNKISHHRGSLIARCSVLPKSCSHCQLQGFFMVRPKSTPADGPQPAMCDDIASGCSMVARLHCCSDGIVAL